MNEKMDKDWLKRRIKNARNIEKRLKNAFVHMKKAPSFDGRAGLMDCLLDIQKLIEKLRWDLEQDEEEQK